MADPAARLWGHDTTRNLVAVMDALPPRVDVLVVSGDIAEDGATAAYERALELTADRARRRHFLAGNHDDPVALRAVLGTSAALEMVGVSPHWTLALVNSQWVGHEEGRVDDHVLAELRDELDAVDTHVVLCLHHPPLSPCASPACALAGAESFRQAIEAGPVRLVLSGHVHQAFDVTSRGVTYLGAPSTFRQLRHGGDPHYTDTQEPPAARLLELHDDGSFASQLVIASPS